MIITTPVGTAVWPGGGFPKRESSAKRGFAAGRAYEIRLEKRTQDMVKMTALKATMARISG
jgi:hypothetical protein